MTRLGPAAFWASWGDCLSMIRNRHPDVAEDIISQLNNVDDRCSPLVALRGCVGLLRIRGMVVRSWERDDDDGILRYPQRFGRESKLYEST